MLSTLRLTAVAALLIIVTSAAWAKPGDGASAREMIGVVKSAVSTRDTARTHATLRALRDLRSPSLRPLWKSLTRSQDPTLMAQGHLALAMLSDPPTLPPASLAAIEDPMLRVGVLTAALDDDLLSEQTLRQLVTWDTLEPATRALIAVRLGGLEEVQPWMIELIESDRPGRSGMGALVLTLAGHQRGPQALAELSHPEVVAAEGSDVVQVMLLRTSLANADRSNRWKPAGDWARDVAADNAPPSPLGMLALQTALQLGADDVLQIWEKRWSEADGEAEKMHLLLAAMRAMPGTPREAFESAATDPALSNLGGALSQLSGGNAAMIDILADEERQAVVQWVVDHGVTLIEGENAEKVLLDLAMKQMPRRPIAVRAAAITELIKRDPDSAGRSIYESANATIFTRTKRTAWAVLGIASSNSFDPALEPTLLGALDADERAIADLALAVLVGRVATDLEREEIDLDRAAALASGTGGLKEHLRVQIAWRLIEHGGETDLGVSELTKALSALPGAK